MSTQSPTPTHTKSSSTKTSHIKTTYISLEREPYNIDFLFTHQTGREVLIRTDEEDLDERVSKELFNILSIHHLSIPQAKDLTKLVELATNFYKVYYKPLSREFFVPDLATR